MNTLKAVYICVIDTPLGVAASPLSGVGCRLRNCKEKEQTVGKQKASLMKSYENYLYTISTVHLDGWDIKNRYVKLTSG